MFKIEIPTARILCARIDNIIILWDKIRKWNEFLPKMHDQTEFLDRAFLDTVHTFPTRVKHLIRFFFQTIPHSQIEIYQKCEKQTRQRNYFKYSGARNQNL